MPDGSTKHISLADFDSFPQVSRCTLAASIAVRGVYMLQRCSGILPLLVMVCVIVGCASPKATTAPVGYAMAEPVQVETAEITVSLLRIADFGNDGTLIKDPGWRDYVIKIHNHSGVSFIIKNVKLLNQEGRYVDSASAYEQVIAAPDTGLALASDVTDSVAGIAAGQFIPFGGAIYGVLSGVAAASSAGEKASAKRAFRFRVLKNIELAPGGQVEGSAFLPHIARPKMLVVDYSQNGGNHRIKIPLPVSEE